MSAYTQETLHRLQQCELEILDAIAKVCADNDIEWFLIGGTALGAARHQGFIPWDDDVDICMLTEHYERFLEVAPTALPERFQLLVPAETPGYAAMFSKVGLRGTSFCSQEYLDAGLDMPIFVDIFPRGRISADPVVRKRQMQLARRYTRMSYLYHSSQITRVPAGWKGKLARKAFPLAHTLLQRITDESRIRRKFEEGTRLSPGARSTESFSFTTPSVKPLPLSMFTETQPLTFEGRSFQAPAPIADYLTAAYGPTWNQLPPEEKRKTHAPVVLDFGDGVNVVKG